MGQALNSEMAKRFEVTETEGFYITALEKGLGADVAGLKANDIIKSVDEISINKFADLSGYLASKRPGEDVNIVYNRNGKESKVKVRLEKINRASFFLMEVRELTEDQRKKFKIQQGLFISDMNNRWLYERGIDKGFIILKINDQEVSTLKNLQSLNPKDLESILFLKPSGEKERILLQY